MGGERVVGGERRVINMWGVNDATLLLERSLIK